MEIFERDFIKKLSNYDSCLPRMRKHRRTHDENWINGSVQFNNWFLENGLKQTPKINLYDTTDKPVPEAAKIVDRRVMDKIRSQQVEL